MKKMNVKTVTRKLCNKLGCTKNARGGSTKCVAHGGGVRCDVPNCTKKARESSTKCKAHGGGARCDAPDCTKSAVGATTKCVAHGGGARCDVPDCTKSAAGATTKCFAHGGGARCDVPDCIKSAQGATTKCKTHGGWIRCNTCTLISVRKMGQNCYECRKGTAKFKQWELEVRETLLQEADLCHFSYEDAILPCSPNKFRGDFWWLLPTHSVVLEVDENYHRYYESSCELKRIS